MEKPYPSQRNQPAGKVQVIDAQNLHGQLTGHLDICEVVSLWQLLILSPGTLSHVILRKLHLGDCQYFMFRQLSLTCLEGSIQDVFLQAGLNFDHQS